MLELVHGHHLVGDRDAVVRLEGLPNLPAKDAFHELPVGIPRAAAHVHWVSTSKRFSRICRCRRRRLPWAESSSEASSLASKSSPCWSRPWRMPSERGTGARSPAASCCSSWPCRPSRRSSRSAARCGSIVRPGRSRGGIGVEGRGRLSRRTV